jgi:hypothetical protein
MTRANGVVIVGAGLRAAPGMASPGLKTACVTPIYPAGGDTPHFLRATSGEYITQVTAVSPLGLGYLPPADDPRGSRRQRVAPR